MKKIISLMLAVILIVMAIPFASAATLGDVNADGDITAVDARLILQVVAELRKQSDLKNPAGADLNDDNQITAVDARIILQIVAGIRDIPAEPEAPSNPDKAEIANLFNTKSAEIAKGNYNWTRNCIFTKDVDVGSATNTLNNIIKSVDENANLNSVVGSFLGVGNAGGNQDDAGKYAIIPMNIKESDIEKVSVSQEQVTLYLKDSKNPTAGGNTAINHVSNDFISKKDVDEAVIAAGVSDMMTVNSFEALYHDIVISARVDSKGNPTTVWISYKMSAKMGFKVSAMKMNGTGEIETKLTYNNIKF